jgi:Ser/Thr protein kinase RdoA (MazF antagonist)
MEAAAIERDALAALLRAEGLALARLRRVARVDCDVWRITPADGGAEFGLRIYPERKADPAPMESEIAWLNALVDDGQHVPRPVADAEGRFLRSWQPHPDRAPRHAVLLTWLPGRMRDRAMNPASLRRVGRFTGRLHETSARLVRDGAIATSRLAFDSDLGAWAAGTAPGMGRLPARLRAQAARVAAGLTAELGAFARDDASWGFVHGDLHLWNLLFVRARAGAIDFSDCGFGHLALDFASTLHWLRFPYAGNHDPGARYPAMRDALLEGYAAERPLPSGIERQVDAYLAARLVVTLEWMLDDWSGFDERAWGPGFLVACERELRAWPWARDRERSGAPE